MATRDGDLAGGDFPGWLADLIGRLAHRQSLADRRGECIYSACPHYGRCFIEKLGAPRAQGRHRHRQPCAGDDAGGAWAARGSRLPTRYVFDEGHHLFEAADGAFAAHLTGQETIELRRWLLGAEARPRLARARPAAPRRGSDRSTMPAAMDLMRDIADAARVLPADGWLQRVAEDQRPNGAVEMLPARPAPARCWRARPTTRWATAWRSTRARSPIDGADRRRRRWTASSQRLQTPMRELAEAPRQAAGRRCRRARLQHAPAHRRHGARHHAPRRHGARGLARHAAIAWRSRCRRSSSTGSRSSAIEGARARCRLLPPLSRSRPSPSSMRWRSRRMAWW